MYIGHRTGEKIAKETSYSILMSCYSPDRTALLITSPKRLKLAKVITINTRTERLNCPHLYLNQQHATKTRDSINTHRALRVLQHSTT